LPDQRVDPIEPERPPSDHRPDIADRVARPPGLGPSRRRRFQKRDIIGIVHGQDRCFAAISGRFRPADRGQDRLGAGRRLGIIGEAAIVQLARRRVAQLPGIEEFAHHASRAGRATQRNTTNPARPERIDPISTPTFTRSITAGSVNARPPMNKLIVNPIPASSSTP